MKIILTENIASLGEIGQVVKVAPGYARNYLLPQGLALKATGENVRELEHRKRMLAQKREKVRQQMMSLAEKLNRVTIVLKRKVADGDRLYGSVSTVDIAAALEEMGLELPRRSIQTEQPLKQLGRFPIAIRIGSDVEATVTLVIEKEE